MKIHRGKECIHIDFSGAEAAWFLEELETVPKGSKFPKLKQVCDELKTALALGVQVDKPRGRPKKLAIIPQVAAMRRDIRDLPVVSIPNRVAQIARDPDQIARNAEALREACEEEEP